VISAGFEGSGRAAELKQAMLDAARPHLLRIVGPNCLGVLSPGVGLNASFAARMPPAGRVALVAQSGAVAAAAMDWAPEHGVGFSHVLTVGDCADVDVGDLLDYLALDRGTDAVLLYLEGVVDARKFMSAARIAARLKPVAVLKAGRSASGAKAALSHTGALAGATAVYEAAFRRAGLLEVDRLGELLQAGAAFAAGLDGAGDRLAILTNGGGAGVLAVDALERSGEHVTELGAQTIAALDQLAPANWSRRNPVDILGDAPPELYGSALKALIAAPEVDAVMVLNCPTGVADSTAAAMAVARVGAAEVGKPVLTAWLGGEGTHESRSLLATAGLPTYETPEDAALTYAQLARARRGRELLVHAPTWSEAPVDAEAARAITEQARADGRAVLTDPEARAVLAAYGVPVLQSLQARTPEEAGEAAETFHGPVALKILSRDISHKSDVGGVRLDLAGAEPARRAAEEMLDLVKTRKPGAIIDGFVVEPMLSRPEAQEILAGVVQDPAFGPVVMVGHGGVAVQVLADRAVGLPPLNEALAGEMIAGTRVSRLLAGYRGRRPADVSALSRVLVALGRLAADLPEIAELDINPLLCDADGVIAVDARIGVRPAGSASPRMAILPYPAELSREIVLNGERLRLRPIRPDDADRLSEMVDSCDQRDVRFRFGGTMRHLSPALVVGLTQIDYGRQMALVAEAFDGAILGVGQLCTDPEGETAEFAVMVRSDQQGHGLGEQLLRALLDYAAVRGVCEVWGDTERGNARMQELARALAFSVRPSSDPAQVRLVRVLSRTLPPA
jgi:acetyltransferase